MLEKMGFAGPGGLSTSTNTNLTRTALLCLVLWLLWALTSRQTEIAGGYPALVQASVANRPSSPAAPRKGNTQASEGQEAADTSSPPALDRKKKKSSPKLDGADDTTATPADADNTADESAKKKTTKKRTPKKSKPSVDDEAEGEKGKWTASPIAPKKFKVYRVPTMGSEGKDPANYIQDGQCIVTTDAAELTGDGTGLFENTVPTSGKCMKLLEPLDGTLPLKGVQNPCATQSRRWGMNWGEHLGHMDFDAAHGRETKAKFKPVTCEEGPTETQKKIFIDAGAREYFTSSKWFRNTYPSGPSYMVHAFERDPQFEKTFAEDKHPGGLKYHAAAVWSSESFMSICPEGQGKDNRFNPIHKERSKWDDGTPVSSSCYTSPCVDITKFLKEVSTPEDFVVLKMDIEGAEWQVIEHMAKTGAFSYVDEMFLECHSGEWNPAYHTSHTVADCHRLFNALRYNGVYVHEWY